MEKKKNRSKTLKIIYAICAVLVFIAGLYYENGYKDINTFFNDISNNISKVSTAITDNIDNTISENNTQDVKDEEMVAKKVNGNLQMHLIDVGQRR